MAKNKITAYFSLAVLIILIILPAIILYTHVPLGRSFASANLVLASLGKLAGLIGLSSFAFALLLSSRFVWLDRLFYGLPKVINVHRWLGVISFSLILLHPLFLAVRFFSTSLQAPLSIFLYWLEPAYVFGYLSILAFMFLVLMTFFWRMKYERLKSLHSLLAIPLMLGAMHGLFMASDVKQIFPLAVYYILLVSLSVFAYLIRLALVKFAVKAKMFIVEKNEPSGANSIKITLRPRKKTINCQPGQFIFVSFPDIKKGEEHPFSISSILPDGRLVIIAKTMGDYTLKMKNLEEGSKVLVDGPYGRFGINMDKSAKQIWLAGGIGITPFISMAQSLERDESHVNLFYIASLESDFVELDNLKRIEEACPNFKLITHVSKQAGRFDLEKLKSLVGDLKNYDFYICGPEGMITSFVEALRKKNIPKSRINIEAFKFL